MKEQLQFKRIMLDYLFFFPPIIALLMYLIGSEEISGKTFMISNVIGIVLLITSTASKYNKLLLIGVAAYFVSYLFFCKEMEGARMYLSATLYTYILLFYFAQNDYPLLDKYKLKRIDKLVFWFTIIIICGQLLTIDNPLSFLRFNYDSVEEDALEKKGFLISHAFGYYLASLTMYFAYRKKVMYMIALSLLCFFFSRRTVVIMCALGWFYYFRERFGYKKALIVASIIGVLLVTYVGANVYFGEFTFSLDPYDNESASFTSGRSRFWGSFIYFKLLQDNMPFEELLFGAGPASSRDFNLQYCGLKVWMHNDFFDILFCLGIVGLVIYIYAILVSCRKLGIYFCIFLLLSANLNGFMLYQTFPILYLFAIIKAIERNQLRKNEQKFFDFSDTSCL